MMVGYTAHGDRSGQRGAVRGYGATAMMIPR